jgi:diadenylate cyclase
MEGTVGVLERISGALMSFDFLSDLLDILLVTFIIYEGIRIIRGSRTFQPVKGLIIIVIIYGVISLANMEASAYLMRPLLNNGLLILVVLFSPELRNMLEKFGRRSITDFSFLGFRANKAFNEEVSNLVNDFCKAANEMSESKTGALVVFERETPLNDVINSGTILDSKSSPELFNSLFFKNSALHDGAVVVRDGRIHAAGCILPLTQDKDLASELGTRHRAAIGMSEQSDAVVVVVSEETGSVSVAINGSLTRDVTRGNLREILLSELLPRLNEEESDDKKRFFSRKKKVKKENNKTLEIKNDETSDSADSTEDVNRGDSK